MRFIVAFAETQSYVLNFHGRVTEPSVKNFQLVQEDDRKSHFEDLTQLSSSSFILVNPYSKSVAQDNLIILFFFFSFAEDTVCLQFGRVDSGR